MRHDDVTSGPDGEIDSRTYCRNHCILDPTIRLNLDVNDYLKSSERPVQIINTAVSTNYIYTAEKIVPRKINTRFPYVQRIQSKLEIIS